MYLKHETICEKIHRKQRDDDTLMCLSSGPYISTSIHPGLTPRAAFIESARHNDSALFATNFMNSINTITRIIPRHRNKKKKSPEGRTGS